MDTLRHFRVLTEDGRHRIPRPMTSRVSSATEQLVSPVNDSRSRIDKSAERIATYVTVYGRKSAERSARSSRTSFRSHRNDESTAETRPVTRSNAPVASALQTSRERAHNNLRALSRQVEALAEEVCLAKSDRLELLRDLATFEHLFSRQTALARKLEDIKSTAETLPRFVTALTEVSTESIDTLGKMKGNLQRLATLRPQAAAASRSRLRKAKTGLRDISSRHHIRSRYRGCGTFSGLKTLVQVAADEALEHFRVDAQTLDGQYFSVSFTHSGLQNLSSADAIRKRILPFLHFRSHALQLQLHFDPAFGATYTTVVSGLRGVQGKLCLVLIQDEDGVRVRSEDFDSFISVPTDSLTAKKSIYEVPHDEVQSVLSQRLSVRAPQLVWLDDPNSLFLNKEKHSRLLDPDYLSEALGDFVLQLAAREEVLVDGQSFVVEILAHRTVEKVRISHLDRSVELDANSPPLALVRDLQFRLLQRSPKTVFRSLELALSIRALFQSSNDMS